MPREKLWIGTPPEKCDVCDAPIENLFYDAKTRYRVWACLCQPCFERVGVGLGTGLGQRFEKQPEGHFLKTGG